LRSVTIVVAATFGFALCLPIRAEQPFYRGVWKIESAVKAPWSGPQHPPDEAEMKALSGRTVTLGAKVITGPREFACKGPQYKISQFSADMLFEGQLGEMHQTNPTKDPLKLAYSLGFHGASFTTLETGCDLDWHFVDPATAEIGLNNYVYTLRKR
jgi:hypothetical protein